jgi:FkbM family methyltransferase
MSIQNHEEFEYDISNDEITLSSIPWMAGDKIKIKLHGGITNGDVSSIFLSDVYGTLPVLGNIVIDIGANIGDSSIYFILRGADKVIALEPSPRNYEFARRNIEENNYADKISILLAGCSTTIGITDLDDSRDKGSNIVRQDPDLSKVPVLTLEEILNENKLLSQRLLLKMDCEGCEYEAILSASHETLRKFSHIVIEYHHGYKSLKKKLEMSGFDVLVERPMRNYHQMYVGYLYAKQRY